MNRYTDFLYARPSFTEGVARILDFGNTLTEFNESLDAAQADKLAMRADWRAVGDDLRRAAAVVHSQLRRVVSPDVKKKQPPRKVRRRTAAAGR